MAIEPGDEGHRHTDFKSAAIQRVAAELRQRLREAKPGVIVPLMLDGSELSASCLAAVLGPALGDIVSGAVPGRFIVGIDPAGRNAWDADAALRKESTTVGRKLVCVWLTADDTHELVGAVDDQVKSSYEFALSRWVKSALPTTARDLAESGGLTIQAASNRLAKASAAGLLHAADREAVAGGGSQYLFIPVG
ncbi:MAG TPA: hypothetical protein VIP11_23125 [Gemmatimonadaceae bacterium]